jgi:hypothetical protein
MKKYEVTLEIIESGQEFSGKSRESWRIDGQLHRDEGAAVTIKDPETGEVISEEWWKHGQRHRDGDEPAIVTSITSSSRVWSERSWYSDGQLHRENGPAEESRMANGIVHVEKWYRHGELHRDGNLPAYVIRDEDTGVSAMECYYIDGLEHRDDGPAYIERREKSGQLVAEKFFQHGVRIDPPGTILVRVEFDEQVPS